MIAGQFDAVTAVTAAAEGCDALVATGMMPAAAGTRSVAEKLGIRSVYATFQQLILPSPHHAPMAYPERPFPPEMTDNRMLGNLDAQSINALFREALNTHRASIGLPPVDDVRDYVRDYVIGKQPWLATDPILDPWRETPDLDVIQTGAWILPDVRPLPAELVAFLAGTVRPGGRRCAPRRRGHHDNRHPGRHASGGGTPGRGSAVLGRPGS